MNPQDYPVVNKINKIIVGIFLLFVIAGSGVYGTMKFMEVYNLLVEPIKTSALSDLNSNSPNIREQNIILNSISKLSTAEIEEKDKLSVLTALVSQENVRIKDRENILDSLR